MCALHSRLARALVTTPVSSFQARRSMYDSKMSSVKYGKETEDICNGFGGAEKQSSWWASETVSTTTENLREAYCLTQFNVDVQVNGRVYPNEIILLIL